jgi:hypothetical protein
MFAEMDTPTFAYKCSTEEEAARVLDAIKKCARTAEVGIRSLGFVVEGSCNKADATLLKLWEPELPG